jgi:hypothetical protein
LDCCSIATFLESLITMALVSLILPLNTIVRLMLLKCFFLVLITTQHNLYIWVVICRPALKCEHAIMLYLITMYYWKMLRVSRF